MNAQTERKISRAIQTATRLVLALPACWPVSFPAFAICVLPPGLGLLSLLRRVVMRAANSIPSRPAAGPQTTIVAAVTGVVVLLICPSRLALPNITLG
jgi:hypothetical protein